MQDDEAASNRGASLTALFRLGQQKGYRLVAATEWNAFFMPEALCQQHHIATYTPEQVKDRRLEAALFHGFDGTMLVAGHRKLVWQGISYGPEDLQKFAARLLGLEDPGLAFEAEGLFQPTASGNQFDERCRAVRIELVGDEDPTRIGIGLDSGLDMRGKIGLGSRRPERRADNFAGGDLEVRNQTQGAVSVVLQLDALDQTRPSGFAGV